MQRQGQRLAPDHSHGQLSTLASSDGFITFRNHVSPTYSAFPLSGYTSPHCQGLPAAADQRPFRILLLVNGASKAKKRVLANLNPSYTTGLVPFILNSYHSPSRPSPTSTLELSMKPTSRPPAKSRGSGATSQLPASPTSIRKFHGPQTQDAHPSMRNAQQRYVQAAFMYMCTAHENECVDRACVQRCRRLLCTSTGFLNPGARTRLRGPDSCGGFDDLWKGQVKPNGE